MCLYLHTLTPLSIDVSTHCLVMLTMTPKIIKVMVNVKKLVNSSHVHANACAVLGTTLINRLSSKSGGYFGSPYVPTSSALFWKQKYLHSALPKVHMEGGRCQVGS